jgi:hypothetical protein
MSNDYRSVSLCCSLHIGFANDSRYMVDVHRPLSTLKYNPIEKISTCSPPPPPEQLPAVYERNAHMHTVKIVRAANNMTKLLTMKSRLSIQSPFCICIIAAVTIAHLSACVYAFTEEERRSARERIRASMGTLKCLAGVWIKAKRICKEVAIIARELLGLQCQPRQQNPNSSRYSPIAEPVVASDSSSMQNEFLLASNSTNYFDLPDTDSGLELGFDDSDMNSTNAMPYDLIL